MRAAVERERRRRAVGAAADVGAAVTARELERARVGEQAAVVVEAQMKSVVPEPAVFLSVPVLLNWPVPPRLFWKSASVWTSKTPLLSKVDVAGAHVAGAGEVPGALVLGDAAAGVRPSTVAPLTFIVAPRDEPRRAGAGHRPAGPARGRGRAVDREGACAAQDAARLVEPGRRRRGLEVDGAAVDLGLGRVVGAEHVDRSGLEANRARAADARGGGEIVRAGAERGASPARCRSRCSRWRRRHRLRARTCPCLRAGCRRCRRPG